MDYQKSYVFLPGLFGIHLSVVFSLKIICAYVFNVPKNAPFYCLLKAKKVPVKTVFLLFFCYDVSAFESALQIFYVDNFFSTPLVLFPY